MTTDSYNRRKMYKTRKNMGLCRNCKNKVCNRSKIFCEIHLEQNLRLSKESRKRNPTRTKYLNIKNRCSSIGITFDLDYEEFAKWVESQPKKCCYCDIAEDVLNFNTDVKKRKLTVDRKNSKLGYRLDNICLSCFRCNNSKSDFFSHEEWTYIAANMIKPRLEEYHRLAYDQLNKAR